MKRGSPEPVPPEVISRSAADFARMDTDSTIHQYRCAAARSFMLIFSDTLTIVLALVCICLLTRIMALKRRAMQMMRARAQASQLQPSHIPYAKQQTEAVKSKLEELGIPLSDFRAATDHMQMMDGTPALEHLSLTFFQLVVLEEFGRSLLGIPLLLLAPLLIF